MGRDPGAAPRDVPRAARDYRGPLRRRHFRRWDDTYAFFVGLFAEGQLAGGRLVARRRRLMEFDLAGLSARDRYKLWAAW